MTAAVFPYAGQYVASHPKKAEDVDIKQRPDLRTLAILDGRLIAAAGITDQHVDTVKLCFGCLHRRGNLSFVRNIEIKRKTIATTARDLCLAVTTASTHKHKSGKLLVEAGGATGNEAYRSSL